MVDNGKEPNEYEETITNLHRLIRHHEPDRIQERAKKTWRSIDPSMDLLHATLGLAAESGEAADLVKKVMFKPNCAKERRDYLDELGDVLYYLARCSDLVGITFEELSLMNRDKLRGGKHGWPENEDEEETQDEIE
jgi:NTP pyrophosphatase (non-canonical NTP hydrolase)